MKIQRLIYGLSMLLLTTAFAACSEDDVDAIATDKGVAHVTLRIGTENIHVTRDASSSLYSDWEDDYVANNDRSEMMYSWRVIITRDGKIWRSFTQGTVPNDDAEIDVVAENLQMAVGTYMAYSFANIGDDNLKTMLSLADFNEGTALTDETVAAAVATMNGNLFVPVTNSDQAPADNSLGGKGIPMSNRQTLNIVETTTGKDLIVVRMLAKMELQFWNETGSVVTLESVTISDITPNAAGNLRLLPSYGNTPDYPDDMDDHHQDIRPNLNGTPAVADLQYTIPANSQTLATREYSGNENKPVQKIAFYVNESATPTNGFSHFFLKIKLTGQDEVRYALIDNRGKKKDGTADATDAWTYIARNDYRIIPVILDDYMLDIIPYDFPAIGVLPASVKEEDGLYTINFHDYGHFHLVPTVKRVSNGETVPFTISASGLSETSWGLVYNNFGSSWGSWTDATKTTVATDDGSFYRTGTAPFVTTDKDGDEVGGFPKWYANTSSPQWSVDGSTSYAPFIFGYIADPGAALAEDKKIYHEFSIYLYKEGMSAPRVMTYHLLMILDKEQMSYARSKKGIRQTKRH